MKMDEVCRLCLADTITYNGEIYEKIQLLMPEIDLNITPTYTLCKDCSNTLNSAYAFKQKCLQTEERIKNYISEAKTPLINLRWIRDQNYNRSNKSLNEVKVKEEYDTFDNNTNSTHLEDYKNINSINEEYNLTFPKEEICKDRYESNPCKEEIEEKLLDVLLICEICNESYKNSIELDEHRLIHSQTTNRNNKRINQTRNKIKRSNETFRYFCDICNKGFKWKHCLTNHSKIHKDKMHTCSICLKKCRHLRHHMRNCHMQNHICEFCNMKFGSNSVLLQHMRTHTGDRPYQCEVCRKGFTQKSSLRAHVRTHQKVKPYMCNICHKAYKVKASLDEHMATHIPNSEKRLICDIATCNRIFKTSQGLQAHKRRHQLEKTIQCSLCDKQFYNTTALTIHTRSHTGETPYECDICHKLFRQKYNMKKHFQAHLVKKI